jgi:hypothetical protein
MYEAPTSAPPEVKSAFVSGSKPPPSTPGAIHQVFAYDELVKQSGNAARLGGTLC